MRMYQPAWEAIKANAHSYTLIQCPAAIIKRLKKGIIDEKNLDRAFVVQDGRKLFFSEYRDGLYIELTYNVPKHYWQLKQSSPELFQIS